jgi:hypothetical protein
VYINNIQYARITVYMFLGFLFIQGDRKFCGIYVVKKFKDKNISLYVKFLFYNLNYIYGLVIIARNVHRA